ncbi:hypothetical protein N9140_00190 [bacterium]|nr:hypothetical protein [bacterium]
MQRLADSTEEKGGDMYGNCSVGCYVVDQSKTDCGDPDTEEDEDIPEIIDLQKALEYLVSERDIQNTYNNGYSMQKQQTAQSTDVSGQYKNGEQLYMIPNLVNRIIMEHYSSTNQKHNHTSDATNYMSRKQKDKMTKLLVAVIVEFAEPYFVRVARRKQQERDKLLLLQQQKKQQLEKNKMTKKKLQSSGTLPQEECTSSSFGFDERAISWATSCIKQLLQLTSTTTTLPDTSNTTVNQLSNGMMNDQLDDGQIPELDALLSASGEHDGMKMEECVQSALLQGLQSRRILQHMGISIQER